ncbi:hypothetical protein IAT38_000257 [Cryptococcus sp. DSM 104549]
MPYPRPPHSIELKIPHVLTDAQLEQLEDLTFLHFEKTLEAWPISLKITTELNETPIPLPPAPAPLPAPSPPPADDASDPGTSVSARGSQPPPAPTAAASAPPPELEVIELEVEKTECTTISVATSTEWGAADEESIRAIVRNILVEIMGGG